jgi:hypothetical protein
VQFVFMFEHYLHGDVQGAQIKLLSGKKPLKQEEKQEEPIKTPLKHERQEF